jgi:hypothetical protein
MNTQDILNAINIRLTQLSETKNILDDHPELYMLNMENSARTDELETLKDYIEKRLT